MKSARYLALVLAAAGNSALAHHGVATLGAISLDGPGAPVETSSSATLGEGTWLVSLKVDHAKFETGRTPPPDQNAESEYNQYWLLTLGYGFKPWLTAYVTQPYNVKVEEPDGQDSRGLADMSVGAAIGFKYDEGFMLTPANESLDDLMDWHFSVMAGMTLPTGNPDKRLQGGIIDPGKSTSFGEPSFSYGLTATRQFTEQATFVAEAAQTRFRKYTYDDGNSMKFGTETRLNAALAYRLMKHAESRFRMDGVGELNYLKLGRDEANGQGEAATGGEMVYGVLGVRLFKDNMSLALALKKPLWTDLNEEHDQQGAEGKEDYRLIANLSVAF
jgi:hypothetical protein